MVKFRNVARGIVVCGMLTSLPLIAQSKRTQAQHLVALTARNHLEVTELELSALRAGQRKCITIAATKAKAKDMGERCEADEAVALKTLKPFVERERDGLDVTALLHDANANAIGNFWDRFQTPGWAD